MRTVAYNPYWEQSSPPVPSLEGIPASSTRYAQVGYLPELSFSTDNVQVDYGTPIFGEITLFSRRKLFGNKIKIRVVAMQSARYSYRGLQSKPKILTRRYKDTVLQIAEKLPLPKGVKYILPFCVEFPTWSDQQKCACLDQDNDAAAAVPYSGHEFLPPSHGIHSSISATSNHVSGACVSYHLEAVIDGTDLVADCPLMFQPSSFLMRVEERTRCSSYGSMGSFGSMSLRFKTTPTLKFTSEPIFHDIATNEGLVWVECDNSADSPQKLERISYHVYKRCHACPTGSLSDSSSTVISYPIASGTCSVDTPIDRGTTSIAVTYKIARNPKLKIIPSFVTCITAVTHELKLVFKCASQRYKLDIPLICATNLASFNLGPMETASNADLHFVPLPQECPSLVEDDMSKWDLSSTEQSAFTME